MRTLLVLGVALGLNLDAQAIVFYSSGNDHNTTDPGNDFPWQNVVEVRSSSGITGSGVYLGNRYVLTAAHVGPTEVIRINSADFSLEPAAPIQVGTADMKLLRLQSDPGMGNILLNTIGANDFGAARLVGYGVGRSASSLLNQSPVTWGDSSTVGKRWGSNNVDGFISGVFVNGYTSDLLVTQFNTNQGQDEAALTLYDSGSALFRFINSQWYLAGIAAYVPVGGSSYANPTGTSNSQSNDDNYFIRISSYATAQDFLGGVAVPEPRVIQLLGGAGLFYFLRRRRSS